MIQAEVAKLVAPKEAENRELERRVRELEEVGEAAEDEALDPDRGVTSLTERDRRLLESLDVGVTVFERVVVDMVVRSKMQR